MKVQCNNLEMYPTNPREVTKKSHQRQRVTVSKPIEEIKMESEFKRGQENRKKWEKEQTVKW